MIKNIFLLLVLFLPMMAKRFIYIRFFGFHLHESAKIGFSLVVSRNLTMGCGSRIGHLSVIKNVSNVVVCDFASIGNLNWISGFPENTTSSHFADQPARKSSLKVGRHSAITNRHLIDCTDSVTLGEFSTFAGFRSQILTHSISITESRQRCGPVVIGDYSFVGTASVLLPNARLPSFSVLGAGSVLNKAYFDEYVLYAGSPARPVKKLQPRSAYFIRDMGYVN